MREIRTIHCGYETLRLRRESFTRDAHFSRKAFPANEQMTALGMDATRRPLGLMVQGYSR
jgi:hypothetical protein